MKKRSGQLKAILVVSLLGGMSLAVAAPAHAASSDCNSGYFCIWRDTSYRTNGSGTARVQFFNYIPDYWYWNYSGTTFPANDSATSVYNRSSGGNDARIYKGSNATGDGYTIGPLSGRVNLATSIAPTGFNDVISSGYFCTSDPNC